MHVSRWQGESQGQKIKGSNKNAIARARPSGAQLPKRSLNDLHGSTRMPQTEIINQRPNNNKYRQRCLSNTLYQTQMYIFKILYLYEMQVSNAVGASLIATSAEFSIGWPIVRIPYIVYT